MNRLPEGWASIQTGEIGSLYCGQSPPSSEVNREAKGTPYVTGPEQWSGDEIELSKWTTSPKRVVPHGCIFVTVKGAGVGTTFPGAACAIGRDIYAWRPSSELSFDYFLRRLQFSVREIVANARGDIPGLSKDHILKHEMQVPPFAEQKRIVAKLDSLSAHSSRAREELQRIPRLVALYKQAVLAAAFRGELTADWRRLGSKLDWRAVRLADVADIKLGKMLDRQKNRGSPVRYLRNKNVRWGSFDLSDLLEMRFTPEELDSFRIEQGDVLVCEGGEPGRSSVWSERATDLKFQKALMRVRFNEPAAPGLLVYFLMLSSANGVLERYFTGTTIKHLTQRALSRIEYPFPAYEEQEEIVRRIEHAFSAIDRLAAEHQQASALLDRLDQSILTKAFRGELVPQNPNDEPASVLLERIRTERTVEGPASKRGRRRKPAAA